MGMLHVSTSVVVLVNQLFNFIELLNQSVVPFIPLMKLIGAAVGSILTMASALTLVSLATSGFAAVLGTLNTVTAGAIPTMGALASAEIQLAGATFTLGTAFSYLFAVLTGGLALFGIFAAISALDRMQSKVGDVTGALNDFSAGNVNMGVSNTASSVDPNGTTNVYVNDQDIYASDSGAAARRSETIQFGGGETRGA
jgi:hypothetical protein